MDTSLRPATKTPVRSLLAFAGVFLVLYVFAVVIAERSVGRAGTETAFQKLLAARGARVDWLVLGASHALPLDYGDVPARLQQDTGQSMMVLAETGAGPLYNRFVLEQALLDLDVKHLVYVIDSFAFGDEEWNQARISDRALLRQTPLRLSTARILADLSFRYEAGLKGLLDYLTGFSKLNPVNRFPQEGWRGAANFDRRFRPSRHAVAARISYLYPEGALRADIVEYYLDTLDRLFDLAIAEGVKVMVIKLPVPNAFLDALPDEAGFDASLRARLNSRGIPLHDLSQVLRDPALYFDTDHLNRDGVETLYRDHLRDLIAPE
ncbi:hypothetical protein [Marimonas arenosa]|uniref:DUF1574 domain-containing protein n=1 Tax=Marimonas arenosa TaxID=1795305 RepID=A0AAE4B2D4_9RHOB|nr:hypothetical protein [Marimonas arenosa]MDQ2088923.1 hypothetical protein [Marimonas arenosa]